MANPGQRSPFQTSQRWGAARGMKISPVFLGILAVTIAGGVALWLNFGNAYVATFVFVLGAYFVVLCLHEFGHAYSAHRAGDAEVAARGYLDLNPLRYVNPVLSIILPIFYVAIGGLPLPGGSVLVNPGVARQKWRASLISAAGPLTNVVFAVIAMVVVAAAVPDDFAFFTDTHQNFWGAVAFFAYLQVAVAILNLIPVPGLDGYGIIEPYLRYETRRSLEPIRQYGILLVLVLLYFAPPIRNGFSNAIDSILNAFGMAPGIAGVGAQHMKFWQQ